MTANFTASRVLITGASAGIGLGIATGFAEAGASVVLTARNPHQAGTAALIAAHPNVHALAMDVASLTSVQQATEAAAEILGGIDILCANAGIYPIHTIEEMTEESWDQVMNVNARGTLFSVQAALPYLRASESPRIILTSSITGPVTGISGLSHYGASKAAQLGFMRSAALELAKDNITVNAILPGLIHTEAVTALGQAFIDSSIALTPAGRLGTPADIANAALFFASPASSFITGQTLIVDGGQTLPEAPGS